MPTELRAALRDAAAMLDSYSEIGFYSDAAKARAKVAEFRALADAPPTVAELLPRVDATHVIRFVDRGGDPRMIVRSETGAPTLMGNYGRGGEWLPSELLIDDLTQPARLVEVSP